MFFTSAGKHFYGFYYDVGILSLVASKASFETLVFQHDSHRTCGPEIYFCSNGSLDLHTLGPSGEAYWVRLILT
jgi:hypothetical protein